VLSLGSLGSVFMQCRLKWERGSKLTSCPDLIGAMRRQLFLR
jgi:hypothetical protein